MLLGIAELWFTVLAFDNWSLILSFVEVELILDISVLAEVHWKLYSFFNFNDEI